MAHHHGYPKESLGSIYKTAGTDHGLPLGGYYECGKVLCSKRQAREWSLPKAARELHISAKRLAKLESGQAKPTFEELRYIRDVYHVGAKRLQL